MKTFGFLVINLLATRTQPSGIEYDDAKDFSVLIPNSLFISY